MWGKIFSAPEIAVGISRWSVFCRGLLVMLIGILIALEPLLAMFTLSILFGWGLVSGGIWMTVSAFRLKKRKWAWGLYGILLLCIGMLLLINPEAELIAFAWSAALLLLSGGVIGIGICLAAHNSAMPNLFCFTASIFSILLGLLLFLCPISGMREAFWVLGILLAAEGVALAAFSFRIPPGNQLQITENSDR